MYRLCPQCPYVHVLDGGVFNNGSVSCDAL
jgi:hypothetical protein